MTDKYTLTQYLQDSRDGIDFAMFKIQIAHIVRLWFATPYPELHPLYNTTILHIKRSILKASQKRFMADAAYIDASRNWAIDKLKEAEDLAVLEAKKGNGL